MPPIFSKGESYKLVRKMQNFFCFFIGKCYLCTR